MKINLPLSADPISVEWLTREGGIRAVAWTDEKGIPFLGIFTLNRMGQPNGLPCWFRRQRFSSDVVIGFSDEKPVIIRVCAHVQSWGLVVDLHLSRYVTKTFRYRRRLFTPWHKSPPPSFGFRMSNEPASYPAGFLSRSMPEEA
jgi:hypothetical protein